MIHRVICPECYGLDNRCSLCKGLGEIEYSEQQERMSFRDWLLVVLVAIAVIAASVAFALSFWKLIHSF